MSITNKYVNSGLLLFFDQIIVAGGSWIFWLLISKIVPSSEVGQSTTIYSLVVLIGTFAQLGLEYPLLKRSASQKKIFGTALVVELIIVAIFLPLILYASTNLSDLTLQQFSPIAIVLFILLSLSFIPRFALLGISKVKDIFLVDTLGIIGKFLLGYLLVLSGFGVFGILLSFLVQSAIIAILLMIISVRTHGFQIGNYGYVIEVIKEALANTPAKFSRTLILSLSVVLLASFGISNSDIGIFYIVLMISIVAGGLAASIAFMVIPTSAEQKFDLSSGSIRIGLSLTAPLISILIVEPRFFLSLIGQEYVVADIILFILAASIFPSSLVMNFISRLNNLAQVRNLISIGILEVIAFIVSFLLLVPQYGSIGAAASILIAFSASFLLTLAWSERVILRSIFVAGLSIVIGWLIPFVVKMVVEIHPIITISLSIMVTAGLIIALKNMSPHEIKYLIQEIIRTRN